MFILVKKLKAVYKFINRCLFTNSKLMNTFQINEYISNYWIQYKYGLLEYQNTISYKSGNKCST